MRECYVDVNIHSVILERAIRSMVHRIPEEHLRQFASSIEIRTEMEDRTLSWLISFIKAVLQSEPEITEWQKVDSEIRTQDIKYPSTWVQAILDRFIPRRWKRWRSKIKYTRRLVEVTCKNIYQKQIYNQCPHTINTPREAHIAFLASDPQDNYLKATSEHYRPAAVSIDEREQLLSFVNALSMDRRYGDNYLAELLTILGLEGRDWRGI